MDISYQWSNGLPFFIAGGVVIGLFVNPKSPVRRYCCSISGKLGVILIDGMNAGHKYLTAYVGLRAVSVIQVDKIILKIGGKRLLSDWEATRVEADKSRYINFVRPDWLHVGEYEARLIAYTPEGFSKSEKFLIKVSK